MAKRLTLVGKGNLLLPFRNEQVSKGARFHDETTSVQHEGEVFHQEGCRYVGERRQGNNWTKGRNVVLDHSLDTPKILNDGVIIARGIDLEEPFTNMGLQLLRQIAKNAGYDGPVVVANVRDQPFGYGFDALTGQYVDMFKAGIVDPVKVTRAALQNAISIGAMILTTDTLITDTPVHIPDFKDIEFGL